mmetsp:Transcript_5430/g.14694  ORF Transcript_5430/g.14694 Transcript_5430/m.14694 type:complete len:543 (-) Transcript_5430:774-2402(-)|eukprot:CAMPEP_0198114162 /NCGR_PEP_ID=MMETSP1442-20131203/5622_1 /TAXON_ID= /ORGANISM="Craspedostauros australis, Strain CCMP3328" /LENGTH=542 /DNA_ID=CAMNT_0043771413 /DNA_START=41 /DNA_END=1669 /DNA_ORIENTATION=+
MHLPPKKQSGGVGSSASTCHDILKTTAAVGGNVMEWLDFAVFGFFSDVIGDVFFPKGQVGSSSTIESFAVFGGAFLMRPIGGVIIGYIGDVYGRKLALELSVFLMAFATLLMGSLPTYERVGPWAIVFLVAVRLCQGLSVGGQLMSSLVYTLEAHPHERWGLYASYVMAAANFGTLMGGVTGWAVNANLDAEQIEAYGWRLPFWAGGILVGWCGFYLKFFCPEDEVMHLHGQVPTTEEPAAQVQDGGDGMPADEQEQGQQHQQKDGLMKDPESSDSLAGAALSSDDLDDLQKPQENPLKLAFARENWQSLGASSLVPMLWSGGLYVSFVWMPIFMGDGKLVTPPVPHSFEINSFALLFVCLFYPVAGLLGDKFSRVTIMTIGGIGIAISGPIAVYLIATKHDTTIALMCQLVLAVFMSLWGAPMCAWLVESFDPASRLTSVSIGYNVAQACSGGLCPLIATVLAADVSLLAPGIIYPVLATFGLCGLLVVSPGHIYDMDGLLKKNNANASTLKDYGSISHDSNEGEDSEAEGVRNTEMREIS